MTSKTHSVAVRMDAELRSAIEQAASADDRSLSALIARILREWAQTHGLLRP